MMSRSWIVWIFGIASTWLVAHSAAAGLWSIEADCEEGDWIVEVELEGFEVLDASCIEGAKSELRVDTGDVSITNARVAATSASGMMCDAESGGEPRFKLECGGKSENDAGFEREEEIEVELEREEEEIDDDEDVDEEDVEEEEEEEE